jgi:hypothetical protein
MLKIWKEILSYRKVLKRSLWGKRNTEEEINDALMKRNFNCNGRGGHWP